jgi:endonuclease G
MAKPEMLIPYDPNFLGDGFVVPLPTLTLPLAAAAFSEGTVLDYTHFSLVMHKCRRVAVFTAHNVDASRTVRGISGGLDWKMDERVGEYQLGPEVYAGNQLDRGHLVRRQDVLWGTIPEARLANKATYFYTNAAPQHRNFNQDEWVCLEDWVLRQATDFCYRLCVFTGPVLRTDDPTLNDLPPDLRIAFDARGPAQIPAAFWKVVVLRDGRAGGDDLSVVAFAMKQSEMWNDDQGSRLLNLRLHQVTLQAIEGWTGLDFGTLRDVDELQWSERTERARELTQQPEWPIIRAPADIVYSGTFRRARGLRAVRGGAAGPALRGAEREVASDCCGGGGIDPREVIATLNRDIARLTDAVAAMPTASGGGSGRSAGVVEGGESQEQPTDSTDPALRDVERRAQAVAAQSREAIRDRVLDFARKIAVQADIARGVLPPAMPSELHRIVGGDLVPPGGIPTCCCIGDATRWFCTGVVVAPTVVLTAAHCGHNITRVMVGGNKVSPSPDSDARLIAVRAVRVHPGYRPSPYNENDITVLILASPANVTPVPLATIEQLRAATEVELVGFGYNDPQRPLGFGVKRRVTAPLGPVKLSPQDDFGQLPSLFGFHPDYELVAGRKGLGRDTCNGDSGGPAYIRDSAGRLAVAGLTSRATREAAVNCGDGGIYVRPDMFRAWINEVLTSVGLGPLG